MASLKPEDPHEHQLVRNSARGQNCFFCGLSDLEISSGVRYITTTQQPSVDSQRISQANSASNQIGQATSNSNREKPVDSQSGSSAGASRDQEMSVKCPECDHEPQWCRFLNCGCRNDRWSIEDFRMIADENEGFNRQESQE
jgi:hypothetical protein